jgi:hypothetical protein
VERAVNFPLAATSAYPAPGDKPSGAVDTVGNVCSLLPAQAP